MIDGKMLDRFKAATPRHQLSLVGLAVLAVTAFLILIWALFLRTPFEPLFSNLRDADAATIVAELERRKIPYELDDGGATIKVPADKVDATRVSVMGEDLPLKGTVGFELFNKSDMGLTDFAQKINYQRALQGELARTIMTLDGVDSARVHLSLGEDRLFREDRIPPKASVTIRMKDGDILADNAVVGIQRLIAAAVPQLEPDNVVILDESGQSLGAAPSAAAVAPLLTPAQEARRGIEQYYEARARFALEQGLGRSPDVNVRIALPAGAARDLNWTSASRDFPITVIVDPSGQASDRQTMETIVSDAVGLNPAIGDAILFQPIAKGPLAANIPTTANRFYHRQPLSTAKTLSDNSSLWLVVKVGVILLLATGFAMMLFRQRGRPPLTPDQQLAFANRIRAALEAEDGNASS